MAERSLLPRRPEDECLPPAHIAAEQFAAERETWVTLKRAAELSGVSASTIRRAIKYGRVMGAWVPMRRGLVALRRVVWLDDIRRVYGLPSKTPA